MAGDIGGGFDGNPRHSKIFLIASGGLMAQRIRIRPPQALQFKTSNPKTRFINSAQH
jgi:hypothetical protein